MKNFIPSLLFALLQLIDFTISLQFQRCKIFKRRSGFSLISHHRRSNVEAVLFFFFFFFGSFNERRTARKSLNLISNEAGKRIETKETRSPRNGLRFFLDFQSTLEISRKRWIIQKPERKKKNRSFNSSEKESRARKGRLAAARCAGCYFIGKCKVFLRLCTAKCKRFLRQKG